MPKIDINGEIREMTEEEVAALQAAHTDEIPEHEWRMQIEAALIELAGTIGGA